MFDLLIKNAKIVDGTGSPWFRADVAVLGGKIARVSRSINDTAKRTIDALGQVVAPGFIDVHSHDDMVGFIDPGNAPKLEQGVTTVINGNCGLGPFPVTESTKALLNAYISSLGIRVSLDWGSFAQFGSAIVAKGLGCNAGFLAPHGAIRIAAMGMDNRAPTREEMETMKGLLAQCLQQGTYGLSTGLIYPPGMFSKPEEIIELCRVVAEYGGVYVCHMRDEGTHEMESIEEVIRVARETGVSVHISHHKVTGKSNWGLSEKTLAAMREARDQGIDISADAYPYTAGSTQLAALLPPWVHGGGEPALKARLQNSETRKEIREYIEERRDWQNFIAEIEGWDSILVTAVLNHPEFVGKTMGEIAITMGKEPVEALLDLLAEVGYGSLMVIFMMTESDVEAIVKDPLVAIASDAVPDSGVGLPHPRGRGTFPRVLKWVREKKLMPIEEAVRKMTSLPANRFGLHSKGVLKEGMDADLTIFDPTTVSDRAEYLTPRQRAEGISYVVVSGEVVVENGVATDRLAGKLLLKV